MGWKHFDLFDAGAPKAGTIPCAYPFEAFSTQHVVYVGEDGHIWEVLWENGIWSPHDLTSFTGAPLQPVVSPINRPTGYVFATQQTQHVIFVRNAETENDPLAGHVHELWWDSAGWHHRDLTSDLGAPTAIALAPSAYAFETQGTQHINYVGIDCHVHELWWDNDGWHHNDLTNAAGAPQAQLNSPKGYVFQDTQHVVYTTEDGNLHEVIWDRGSWGHNPVTSSPANVLAAPNASLAAYVFAAQSSQHIDYLGADGSIYEVSWDSAGTHYDNLIIEAGGSEGENPSVLCAYAFEDQGTRHVDYTGGSGHVIELWHDDNGWHHNDLTEAAGGAPPADQGDPAGYAFAVEGTQHVFYIGIGDNHIHELRWEPPLTPAVPVGPIAE